MPWAPFAVTPQACTAVAAAAVVVEAAQLVAIFPCAVLCRVLPAILPLFMLPLPFTHSTHHQEAGGRVAALCDGTAEGGETGGCYYVRRVAQPLAHGAAGMLGDEAAAAAAWARSCQDAGITGAPWVPKLPC